MYTGPTCTHPLATDLELTQLATLLENLLSLFPPGRVLGTSPNNTHGHDSDAASTKCRLLVYEGGRGGIRRCPLPPHDPPRLPLLLLQLLVVDPRHGVPSIRSPQAPAVRPAPARCAHRFHARPVRFQEEQPHGIQVRKERGLGKGERVSRAGDRGTCMILINLFFFFKISLPGPWTPCLRPSETTHYRPARCRHQHHSAIMIAVRSLDDSPTPSDPRA